MIWLVLLTKFDIRYVSQKFFKESIVAYHLASLPISGSRAVDDDFPNEEISIVTGFLGWCMYFDVVSNNFKYGIGVLLISPHGDHILR